MSKELYRKFIESTQHKAWEFRLFKKSVREYVSDDVYRKIADEYNRKVAEYRKSGGAR
jgi:hypothetical protein